MKLKHLISTSTLSKEEIISSTTGKFKKSFGQNLEKIIVHDEEEYDFIQWFIKEYEYNLIKFLIYKNLNDGYWEKRIYNEKGLETMYEDSNQNYKRTYYEEDSLIKYRDSDPSVNFLKTSVIKSLLENRLCH